MMQADSQPTQALAAQSLGAAASAVVAPTPGVRTVALSLLVDRALSA
ncbi:hypothetical protein [Paraburkholderia ribeironis]|nr:hypothetical protein [Paraburkholderia ribeironis]